jgi:tripartite-type tricarboxylate transporter receptor subunit TctC
MRIRLALLTLLSLAAVPAPSPGQVFPSRTIILVCPFPPGSTSDLIPRMVAPLLSEAMGVPVVVENRPGAAGSIGAGYAAKSRPDGHTVLMAPTPVLAINQWLYKALPYNPEKDFVPITNAATTPNLWVVHPSVPAKNLKELIALAKTKPNLLSFASGGSGTTSHMCGELFKSATGANIVHVPYKGPAPAHQDLLSGRVPLMCDNLSNVIPYVRTGRLRAIALTGQTRHPQAPEIPTAHESGLPGFEASVWYSFVAPAGTPKPLIDRLNTEFARALRTPVVTERLTGLGLTIVADTPEEFGRFVAAESAKWRKVVQASGARID